MEFRAVADRVLWPKSQGFESNVKSSTIQSNVERRAHTDMEVSEPGPPVEACPTLWRIPKRITRYLDTARSTRATTFARGGPVFHGVRQGQARFWRTASGRGRSL